MQYLISVAIICSVLAGCASPINIRTMQTHTQYGYQAQGIGDWEAATRHFARAVVNSDLGNADPRTRAIVNYEYGRGMGVVCEYSEAEKYLLRAIEYDRKAKNPPYLSLFELALVYAHQGKFEEAIQRFSELVTILETEKIKDRYPLGVAEVYERYALALEKVARSSEAETRRSEARAIRTANPAATPFGKLTPYGTRCRAAS